MKSGFLPLAACLTLLALPALAAPVCVNTRYIASTDTKDGKILTFRMNDGTILRNRLQGTCSDLRFNGFAWNLADGDDQVCEGQQSLTVINSGQVCILGKFDPPQKPKQ